MRTGRVGQSSARMVDAATTMPSNPSTTVASVLAGVNRFFIMCASAPFRFLRSLAAAGRSDLNGRPTGSEPKFSKVNQCALNVAATKAFL
jgi:hypothetical protein